MRVLTGSWKVVTAAKGSWVTCGTRLTEDPFEEAKQRMGEAMCVWVYGYRTFESGGGFVGPL